MPRTMSNELGLRKSPPWGPVQSRGEKITRGRGGLVVAAEIALVRAHHMGSIRCPHLVRDAEGDLTALAATVSELHGASATQSCRSRALIFGPECDIQASRLALMFGNRALVRRCMSDYLAFRKKPQQHIYARRIAPAKRSCAAYV